MDLNVTEIYFGNIRKPITNNTMKNTLKPLPTFEAKEKTSEPSYAKELRCAFLEGYKEARKEFQKDKERLDWIEKDGTNFRKAIDKEMED